MWLSSFERSVQFSSVAQSCPTLLEPHGLQHTRPPCPSPTPVVYSNSYPLSQWCHSTISSSVIPFSSHPQSFPASGSFLRNQFFTSGGQSIGVSASASILPMNIQDWSPLGWTGWISKGLSRVFSNTTVQKHRFFSAQLQNDKDGGGVGNGREQVCCMWRSSLSFTELPWWWGRASLAALESHLNQVLMVLASGPSGTL